MPAIRRQGQSAGNALHELALIVLGKGKHALKPGRGVAVRRGRIERWQHNRARDPGWALRRHWLAASHHE